MCNWEADGHAAMIASLVVLLLAFRIATSDPSLEEALAKSMQDAGEPWKDRPVAVWCSAGSGEASSDSTYSLICFFHNVTIRYP